MTRALKFEVYISNGIKTARDCGFCDISDIPTAAESITDGCFSFGTYFWVIFPSGITV